jgi:hypothetical protein
MGLVASPTLIAAQSSVGWSERGVVTANNLFFRSIGSAVGVAVFGAIANATLGSTSGAVTAPAIAEATHDVFIAALVLAAVMVAAAFLLPGGKPVIAEAGSPPEPAVGRVPETAGDVSSPVTAPRRPADRPGSVPRPSDPE